MTYMTKIGYHTLEFIIPLILKLTQKTRDTKKLCFLDWKIQFEKVQSTEDLEKILYYIKEYACLVKMTKAISILTLEPRQPLFGSLKTRVPHFKLLNPRKND